MTGLRGCTTTEQNSRMATKPPNRNHRCSRCHQIRSLVLQEGEYSVIPTPTGHNNISFTSYSTLPLLHSSCGFYRVLCCSPFSPHIVFKQQLFYALITPPLLLLLRFGATPEIALFTEASHPHRKQRQPPKSDWAGPLGIRWMNE